MTDFLHRTTELERSSQHDRLQLRYRMRIPAGSAYLVGHFPGEPVLPGVAQLQICAEAVAESLGRPIAVRSVAQLRFRKPVRPEVDCELIALLEGREVHFTLHGPEGLMADGRWEATESLVTPPRSEPLVEPHA
jgi:3-hydroxymyristoyl/3-hydroxydecanoyl-(acyl carrier protein) dehydratase